MTEADTYVYFLNGSHSLIRIVPLTKIDKRAMECKHNIQANSYMNKEIAPYSSLELFFRTLNTMTVYTRNRLRTLNKRVNIF